MATSVSAQIQLDRFFPPVVAAGQKSLVTAEGKFPAWPIRVQVDAESAEIRIVPENDSGKLNVSLPADAPPGVAWIRMFDDQSASKLVPLIVSSAPVSVEKEPNNMRSEANELKLPTVVAGRLAKSGDSDAFRVEVKAGQQIVVNVTANQVLKSPMDAVLQIADLRGNVLMQSDDQRGLDPQLVYRVKRDRQLLIRIFAFPETPNSTVGFGGSASFVYAMDVTTGPFVDHVADIQGGARAFGYNLMQEPSVTLSKAETGFPRVAVVEGALGWSWIMPSTLPERAIAHDSPHDGTLPVAVIGHLLARREAYTIPVSVKKDVRYRAEVRSKIDGFLLDSMLKVIDQKSGTLLASNDDVSKGRYDAAIDFTAKSDGKVDVQLTEMLEAFGPRHFYQLTIQQQEPTFSLSLASDRFVMDGKKSLEIPVTVARLSGFSGKIRIAAVELPPGVTADPVISEAKGDTAKSVKLKLDVSKSVDGHNAFRVVGTALDEGDQPVEPNREAAFALRPSFSISQLWLTVTGQTQEKEE